MLIFLYYVLTTTFGRYIEGNPAAPYESLSINEFGLKQRVKSGVSASFEPAMMVNTYTGTEDVLGPDIILFLAGRPVGAHRAILAARSPFFRRQFETGWKGRREVRLANPKLKFAALFSLLHFFYTDRLDVAVDDMEDLVRICKVCGCDGLRRALESEIVHQKYADYKSLKGVEDSQKRFILQASSLPEGEQLPAAMQALLALALENSTVRVTYQDKDIPGNGVGHRKRETMSKLSAETELSTEMFWNEEKQVTPCSSGVPGLLSYMEYFSC